MRRLILLLVLAVCIGGASAQTKKEVRRWLKNSEWRQGFTAANPHKTVNLSEFYRQYHKNPQQWEALFAWLAKTDLQAIPKGKHPIEGTGLTVSVEDSKNEVLEKRRSESHYKHIDFQYVVRGTEGFALLDHESSPANCAYDVKKDVIHYEYKPSKTHFFDVDASENKFVIFFPDDWHIAKIATQKESQDIRVIVIKVDYKE